MGLWLLRILGFEILRVWGAKKSEKLTLFNKSDRMVVLSDLVILRLYVEGNFDFAIKFLRNLGANIKKGASSSAPSASCEFPLLLFYQINSKMSNFFLPRMLS